jgi:hypothetical protein
MRTVQLQNRTHSLPTSLTAAWCDSFLCKLRGLTWRRELPQDWGLLLVERADSRINTAIHMMFVFFDLGIVWINDAQYVVDVQLAHPWFSFLVPSKPARYILEIHPDRLVEFNIGDEVAFDALT